jgi:diguanylate cyclase (GGDEF)-like protein
MDKRIAFQRGIFYIAVFLLFVYCIAFFLFFKRNYKDIETFASGPVWTVTLPDGSVHEGVDLAHTRLQYHLKEGEALSVEADIPSSFGGELTAMAFTRQSALVGYVNDREIYHYREDQLDRFVGNGYQFVQIPVTGSERHLRLDVIGCRGRSINSIPNIVLTRSREIYSYFLGEHMIMMFCGVFLVLLGLLVTCISLIYFSVDYDYYPLVLIGLIGILSGIWCTSNVKTLELLSLDIGMNSFMEYISLYFMPAPVLQFIRFRHEKERRSIILLNIGTAVVIVFAVVTMLLHSSGKIIISDALPVFHMFVGGYIVLILLSGVKSPKKMEHYEYYYLIGFVISIIASLAYIVRFQISNIWGIGSSTIDFSFLPLAILIFVLFLIFGYLGFIRTRVVSRAEKEILEQRAYEDRMTGLFNRAKGESLMHALNDRSNGDPYAIVNFDMNGLKRTNDTLGHYTGDAMLIRFAKLLQEHFGSIGTPIRMSGDEFIVLVRGMGNIVRIDDALRGLVEDETRISAEEDYVMDAAYGVAKSMEFLDPDAESVYRMADDRMFEMKVASQKGRE